MSKIDKSRRAFCNECKNWTSLHTSASVGVCSVLYARAVYERGQPDNLILFDTDAMIPMKDRFETTALFSCIYAEWKREPHKCDNGRLKCEEEDGEFILRYYVPILNYDAKPEGRLSNVPRVLVSASPVPFCPLCGEKSPAQASRDFDNELEKGA